MKLPVWQYRSFLNLFPLTSRTTNNYSRTDNTERILEHKDVAEAPPLNHETKQGCIRRIREGDAQTPPCPSPRPVQPHAESFTSFTAASSNAPGHSFRAEYSLQLAQPGILTRAHGKLCYSTQQPCLQWHLNREHSLWL